MAAARSLSAGELGQSARRDCGACTGGGVLMALIGIKPSSGPPHDNGVIAEGPPPPELDTRVTNHPPSRFAVAAYDSWSGVHTTLHDLCAGGSTINELNCLGLHRVLAAGPGVEHALPLRALPFQKSPELISCTLGPVAERLAQRLALGAPSLQVALSHWLIPRHAAQLQNTVQDGRLVLWVQLFDAEDERRAYQALLARSATSVGVHDLNGDES
jgi:hypothetical protein